MQPDVITVKFVTDLGDEDQMILTTADGEFVVVSTDTYRELKRMLAERIGVPEDAASLIGRRFERTQGGLSPAD